MFGLSAPQMQNQTLDILIPDRFRKRHHTLVSAFGSDRPSAKFMKERNTTLYGLRHTGEEFPVDVSILKSGFGPETQMVAIIRDVTEQKKLEDDLKTLASTDPLTGILNRRSFLERAEQERDRALRYGHALSVAMIDVDHFKKINDRFGHQCGDLALQHLVAVISEQLRTPDIFGRLGGEEFGVLLPAVEDVSAAVPAERYRRAIEQTPLKVKGLQDQIRLSVSIGLACLQGDGDSLNLLLQRADTALYAAKSAGRNRISHG